MSYKVGVKFLKNGNWVNYAFHDDAVLEFNAESTLIKDNGKILFVGDMDDAEYSVDGGYQVFTMDNVMSETMKALYPDAKGITKAAIKMDDSAATLFNELGSSNEGTWFSLKEQDYSKQPKPVEDDNNTTAIAVIGILGVVLLTYGMSRKTRV